MATWPPYVDDDGTGTTGTPTDKALFDAIKAYIDGQTGAMWQPIAITGTATAGTFTLSSIVATTSIDPVQRRVFLDLIFTGATSASTTFVYIDGPVTLPLVNQRSGGAFNYWGAGVSGIGLYQTTVGQRRVECLREAGGTPWPVHGGINFYIQLSYVY